MYLIYSIIGNSKHNKTLEFILTQSNCVIDAKAAENFLYISGMKETISLDDHLERFWSGIEMIIYVIFLMQSDFLKTLL